MKALVVEPSKMYQLLLNEFLNGFSISHEVVTTGEAALIELAKEPVDFIIIAMNLSDTLATTLACQIKSQKNLADTTIVIMTGEQDSAKLLQLETADINYVCQRHELNQLKDILTKLTQGALTIAESQVISYTLKII
jgi:two-component system cell cycle response regulator